jgi:ribosomal protein L40E
MEPAVEPETKAAEIAVGTQTCQGCGAINKTSAKFCRQCGLAQRSESAARAVPDDIDNLQVEASATLSVAQSPSDEAVEQTTTSLTDASMFGASQGRSEDFPPTVLQQDAPLLFSRTDSTNAIENLLGAPVPDWRALLAAGELARRHEAPLGIVSWAQKASLGSARGLLRGDEHDVWAIQGGLCLYRHPGLLDRLLSSVLAPLLRLRGLIDAYILRLAARLGGLFAVVSIPLAFLGFIADAFAICFGLLRALPSLLFSPFALLRQLVSLPFRLLTALVSRFVRTLLLAWLARQLGALATLLGRYPWLRGVILGFLRRERPDYPVLIPTAGVSQFASATRRRLFTQREYLVLVEGAPLRRGLGAWLSLTLKQIVLPFYWERTVHVLYVPNAVRNPLTQAVSAALGKGVTPFADLPRDAGTDWTSESVGDTSALDEKHVLLPTPSAAPSVTSGQSTHVSPVPVQWVMASLAAIAVIATLWVGIARFRTTPDPDTTTTAPTPASAVPSERIIVPPTSEVTTAPPIDMPPALSAPIAPAALTPESTTTAAPLRSAAPDDVQRQGRTNALDTALAEPRRANPVVEVAAPTAQAPSIAQPPETAAQATPAPASAVTPAPPSPSVTTSAAAPPDAQGDAATRTSPPPVTPEPASYQGLLVGTLTYSGPPIVQNGEIVFRNLPPVRLALTYNQDVWEARLSPGEGNTQRLIMRNKRPGTQKQCVVTWRVIQ